MESIERDMLKRACELLVEDEKRIPVVIEHSEEIACLSLACTIAVMDNFDKLLLRDPTETPRVASAVRAFTETLFYLGYQHGLKEVGLDHNVWNGG